MELPVLKEDSTDYPRKWTDKSFKENDNFSMKKVVGSAHDLSLTGLFTLD